MEIDNFDYFFQLFNPRHRAKGGFGENLQEIENACDKLEIMSANFQNFPVTCEFYNWFFINK